MFDRSRKRFDKIIISEWNAATEDDWRKIRQLFVAAYIEAYKDCSIDQLGLGADLIEDAKKRNSNPLELNFTHEFNNERGRIANQEYNDKFKINYLVIRLHDEPVGFIASQLNFKTGRIYIRWNTVSPTFHRLGIGRYMLNEVQKFYECKRIELYTRKANASSRQFYENYGLVKTDLFSFEEPLLPKDRDQIGRYIKPLIFDSSFNDKVYPPADERVEDISAFVGYLKNY